MSDDYSYIQAGFDNFLSRSIDNLPRNNLDGQGPTSTAIRYDSAQLSGFIGDTIQIGSVRITNNAIIMNDGSNDVLLIGDETNA